MGNVFAKFLTNNNNNKKYKHEMIQKVVNTKCGKQHKRK